MAFQDLRCGLINTEEEKENLVEQGKPFCALVFSPDRNADYVGGNLILYLNFSKQYPVVPFYIDLVTKISSPSVAIAVYDEKKRILNADDTIISRNESSASAVLNTLLMKAISQGCTKISTTDLRNGIINTAEAKENLLQFGKPSVIFVVNSNAEKQQNIGDMFVMFFGVVNGYPIIPCYIDNVTTNKKVSSYIEVFDGKEKVAEVTKNGPDDIAILSKAINGLLLKAISAKNNS